MEEVSFISNVKKNVVARSRRAGHEPSYRRIAVPLNYARNDQVVAKP
jgi:hypothetical protein